MISIVRVMVSLIGLIVRAAKRYVSPPPAAVYRLVSRYAFRHR